MIQEMMDINTRINHFIWGIAAIICIMGVGFYLTYITGFIQFKKLGYTMKETIGKAFQKKEAMEGTLSPFQAVCTALAATVGTGNIAGVAGAIAIVCFAFSTIIAWGLYGARFIAFLFPNKVEKIFFIVYFCMALAGATLDLKFIWEISDTFNGLMSIPNLIALFLLAKVFAKEVREYFSKRNLKEIEDLYL